MCVVVSVTGVIDRRAGWLKIVAQRVCVVSVTGVIDRRAGWL